MMGVKIVGMEKVKVKLKKNMYLTLTWTVSIQKRLKSVINGICHTLI